MKRVLTTCPYCGTGCTFYLDVRDGRVVGVIPARLSPVSKGVLCVKGWHAYEPVHHPDRIIKPLIKKNGKFKAATWDNALNLVAKKLAELKKKYGSDALGVWSSARCTNEENYLIQKFARAVLGTNNVDHCARTCHSATVAGLIQSFGSGAGTNSFDELFDTDCILIIGSNTTEAHPLVGWRVRTAVDRGAKVIVIDPRKIELADIGVLHLAHYPGTDIPLINSLINVIVSENLHNKEFINARTEGFNEMWQVVQKYTPEYAQKITGVEPDLLRNAARMYASARNACIVYSLGITEHITGTRNVIEVANLALVTGHIGRELNGVMPLRGQNNVQGACDMGALPNVYSGYQRVVDEPARLKFEKAWKVKLPANVGLTTSDMLIKAREKSVKALYIVGEDPMRTEPNTNAVKKSLDSLEFLVVQEIFMSETAKLADVILPGASYAEKDGTFTNGERRVQRVRPAIAPLPGKTDGEIICEVARRMGYKMVDDPKKICDEVAALSPLFAGIVFERLDGDGLQWPCTSLMHPGTKVLHREKFTRGLGKFFALEHEPAAELPDKEFPMILSTGRMLFHYNNASMTSRTALIRREFGENFVQINPADAAQLGIHHKAKVKVRTRRGELVVNADVTDDIKQGVLWMPFHFNEVPTNILTNDALDPTCRIGEYKVCAAKVEKV